MNRTIMPRYLIIFLVLGFTLTISGCKMSEKKTTTTIIDGPQYSYQQGIIKKDIFVDKGGREHPEIVEYYFKSYYGEEFINLSKCKNLNGNIEDFANKLVRLRIILIDGLWDTDDPNVQSRVGIYAVIDSVQVIGVPVKLDFVDGNGNKYEILPGQISYNPVSASESSSGVYSGGEASKNLIKLNDFFDAVVLAEHLLGNKQMQSDMRAKGTGYIKVYYEDYENAAVIISSEELDKFSSFLSNELLQSN